jgi:hypothetical protein
MAGLSLRLERKKAEISVKVVSGKRAEASGKYAAESFDYRS